MRRSRILAMVVVAGVLVVGGCVAGPGVAPSDGSAWTVTVESVTDGDTMEVRFADGTVETVRLLGVDTPETTVTQVRPGEWESIPDTEEGRDWLANWAGRATAYARTELTGETVTIRVDPDADRRGGYGRLLVYLYPDDRDVAFNYRLLERGYARYYDSQFTEATRYQKAEAAAREAGVGVWGADTHSDVHAEGLAVADVHADAAGNDHENRNDEYIVLTNRDNRTLALGGWTVSDAAGHTYQFPDGVTLEPEATLTLYTGGGANGAGELYWGAGGAIWNNGGDTVVVRDAGGRVVLEHAY